MEHFNLLVTVNFNITHVVHYLSPHRSDTGRNTTKRANQPSPSRVILQSLSLYDTRNSPFYFVVKQNTPVLVHSIAVHKNPLETTPESCVRRNHPVLNWVRRKSYGKVPHWYGFNSKVGHTNKSPRPRGILPREGQHRIIRFNDG